MRLHALDIAILIFYCAAMVIIGFAAEKKAARGMSAYFLGGNRLPWWLLSLSNATTMFDISGTMWLVYLLYVYGLKSVFIPWLWPVFNQIFLMVYLSSWVRRSKVLTGGEWITLRFGTDRGAELSRASIIFFALVSVVAFTSYAFIGIGKFASVFLPSGLSPNTYGIILVALTTLYTVMGGFYSVVFTDVVQFFLKTAACLAIGVIAMARVSPAALASSVPSGWMDIRFGWRLDIDWSRLLPSVGMRIANDGYSMFGAFFMMMLFKGILVSGAGPAPNYDMQRILACRSPREASFMSGLVSVVLFPARYFMIAGITVLALVYLRPAIAAQGMNIDFERILPLVIRDFVPAGLAGLLIAGFLAAFMSTFAGTINAAAAYIVNDIYKRYVNRAAPDKTYVRASYLASTLVVIVGCGIGYFMTSIHSITEWIVAALWGGYAAPNLLKWHWWRFNGHGYFWGMMVGVLGALVLAIFPSVSPIMAFPLLFAVSTIASIAGSLATPPVDKPTLAAFYLRTRPWGWWKPIEETARRTHPGFVANTGLRRDMVNVVVGIVWQTSLVAMAIYTVLKNWTGVLWSVALVAVCSFVLKKNWLDKMEADNTCDLATSTTSVANLSSRKTS